MKPIKGLLIILLALAVVFTFGAPALAAFGSQSDASGGGGIQVVKDAPGTKYSGPLTIYYTGSSESGLYDMHFFLRLRKGSNLYAFSGTATDTAGDVEDMQNAIESFFNLKVIPILYPGVDLAPLAQLKAVDQFVDDNTSECCGDMVYTIMDVVIAVQD